MDAFKDKWLIKIILAFATQLGKTEMILNCIGYAIDQDPGAMMMVYPTETAAKSISKNRIRPMLDNCPALSSRFLEKRSETLELQFLGMFLSFAWANSPSALSSKPVRYVFFDETDKFPSFSGKEGDPADLAGERTKTYSGNKKEIHVSSPTVTTGHIWRQLSAADVVKRYFVPCPHCGTFWTFRFPQIKWPSELNEPEHKRHRASRARHESWYECESCHGKIHDMDKFLMLQMGEWRPVVQDAHKNWIEHPNPPQRPSAVAYNISSIYSPWVTFGEVAEKFLKAKDEPAKLMNFINGWLGEPWEAEAVKMRSDIVLERQSTHTRGTVPAKAQILTCGVDVQPDCYYYSIRAWGIAFTSWLVEFGRVETWGELQDVLDREYPQEGGDSMVIGLTFVDSGYRADETYDFCATQPGTFPCKGSSKRLQGAAYTESKVDKDGYGAMRLFIVDGHYYKDFISGRLRRETDSKGSFNLYNAEDDYSGIREYANQLCAEQLVRRVDTKGKVVDTWEPVTSHAQNHYLDTEVYAAAAAERAGVRYLREEGE